MSTNASVSKVGVIVVTLQDVIGAGGDVERAIERVALSSGYGLCQTTDSDVESENVQLDDVVFNSIADAMADRGTRPSEQRVLNLADGRVARGIDKYGPNGEWTGEFDWTEGSKICLVAPTVEEILEGVVLVEAAASMAEAVFATPHEESSASDWWAIQEAVENITNLIPEPTGTVSLG